MNSKKRVLSAFAREPHDRVPIDFSTNEVICGKLIKHLGVSTYEDLLKAFNVDFRGIGAPYAGKLIYEELPGMTVDPIYGHYTKWVENSYGGYWDFCHFPLQGADSEQVMNFPVPSPDDFDYSNVLAEVKSKGEYALFCGSAGMADVINSTGRVMGMEDTLVNLITGDEATMCYIEKRMNMQLGILERIIDSAQGGIDFLWIGEDLGTQRSPMISRELYKSALMPIHKRYVDLAKSRGLPVMVHTCGCSSWAYEDFIEMGVDAVDTLQPEAENMSPKYLVENFGGRLSFHGCISTAGALASGGTSDVREEVREVLEVMKPTRAYMLAPTHQIQDNSPVENVIELYRSAIELGKYD